MQKHDLIALAELCVSIINDALFSCFLREFHAWVHNIFIMATPPYSNNSHAPMSPSQIPPPLWKLIIVTVTCISIIYKKWDADSCCLIRFSKPKYTQQKENILWGAHALMFNFDNLMLFHKVYMQGVNNSGKKVGEIIHLAEMTRRQQTSSGP